MATNPKNATVTLDDFIAAAEASEQRLEFVDGQIVAMSGASILHGRIAQRITSSLDRQLENSGCEILRDTLVAAGVADNKFVPDVIVFCGEPEYERLRGIEMMLNPVVLIEVLSPTTANYDHVTKWENYRRIPSLREYLLVSQDRPRVEQYTRQDSRFWRFSETEGRDSEIRIESLNATLSLARIYAGLRLGAAEQEEAPAE
ncbi:Uma2 family endonuclease [Longimicrobium terrae]|uniref:Uma2 family endonuclease n=1 Tax=Longimicrobium terrae TaxID=1639882 RepID=A0A841GY83_9BACT|nr:Uma2 family endonuclease [Longimicrobium terrae]MBB4636302.1 Uma2 family endonuclease [Longimicrobium terrae]MBB6070698.1 Uma2 family endonuclease [Longimicrobium terrae]NNC29679.1 Uma2 family endonuclease [Longimicrobium terrae]